ncbi:hypothetical protein HDV01_006695 [Terramyces sp. JEL0728]|nr:hypothetical protein HDV01_006695 [Terramyces sp. JEL0728]
MQVNENTFLRHFRDTDAPVLAELLNNENVTRFTTIPFPYKLEHAVDFIKQHEKQESLFAIVQEDVVVGAIEYMQRSGCFAHVAIFGYWLKPELWNQGIVSKATGVVLEIIKRNNETAATKILKIKAAVCTGNEFSGRALLKNGFEKEGVLRKDFCKNGVFTDSIVYGKLLE